MTTKTNLHLSEAGTWENAFTHPFSGEILPGASLNSHSGSFGKIVLQKISLPGIKCYKITTASISNFSLSTGIAENELAIVLSLMNPGITVQAAKMQIDLRHSKCCFVYSQNDIELKFKGHNQSRIFLFHFEKKTLEHLLRNVNADNLQQKIIDTSPGLISMDPELTSIIYSVRNCSYPPKWREFYLQSRLTEFLLHVLYINFEKKATVLPLSEKQKSALDKVEKLLSGNPAQNISIRQLAKQVSLNSTYLKSLFRKKHGKTIHDFKVSTRMELAKEMLIAGKSVKEVSFSIGYRPQNFIPAFKKYVGVSPGSFKKGS